MESLLSLLKKLEFVKEAFCGLMHDDWVDVAAADLKKEHRENPEKYIKDCVDQSFEWLGTEGGNHDGETLCARFKLDGKIYQGEGYYSSWDSSEYPTCVGDYYEVEQYEKTIKCYRKVN